MQTPVAKKFLSRKKNAASVQHSAAQTSDVHPSQAEMRGESFWKVFGVTLLWVFVGVPIVVWFLFLVPYKLFSGFADMLFGQSVPRVFDWAFYILVLLPALLTGYF